MKPAAFDYARPRTADEAVRLLACADGAAKAIAGGQSLGPMLNLRLAQPALLVDISRLAELRGVEARGDAVVIGAAVRHAEIEDGIVAAPALGFLRDAAGGIGYRAVRNRGTIGGSLAHADPGATWPAYLVALGARLALGGTKGKREVAARDFILGPFTTVLAADEIIEAIIVPLPSPAMRAGSYKVWRKTGEFAHSLAVIVIDRDKSVANAVLGGTKDRPVLLTETARSLARGASWSDSLAQAIGQAALADLAKIYPDLDPFERDTHRVAITRAARKAIAA